MSANHTYHQHYIPQFYLRNFADKTEKVYVLNRNNNRITHSRIKNIGFQNDIYETRWKDANPLLGKYVLDNQIEKKFGDIEANAATIIKDIIDRAKTDREIQLSQYSREVLCEFLALLFLRNPVVFNQLQKDYADIDKEIEMVPVMQAVTNLLNDIGRGGVDSLLTHSVKTGIFDKTIPGSPAHEEYTHIESMNWLFWFSQEGGFCTCDFPLIIDYDDDLIWQRVVLPLSENVACVLFEENFPLICKNRVIEVRPDFVSSINERYIRLSPEFAQFIISGNEAVILRLQTTGKGT